MSTAQAAHSPIHVNFQKGQHYNIARSRDKLIMKLINIMIQYNMHLSELSVYNDLTNDKVRFSMNQHSSYSVGDEDVVWKEWVG